MKPEDMAPVGSTDGLERAAFDEWVSDSGKWPGSVQRSGDGYRLMQTQQAWMVWEIAIAHERDACAKLCDERADVIMTENRMVSAYVMGAECGAAIRARSNAAVTGAAKAD